MTRYYIESVKCGVSEGGMGCGPIGGPVVVEANITTDSGEKFILGLAEVEGIPNFYKSEISFFDQQIEDDFSDEEEELFQDCFLDTGDYDEIFENPEDEYFQLYRYLIYIARADWDECEQFQNETTGKYLDEIDIPASDVEEYSDYDDCDEEDFEYEEITIPESKEELYKLRLTYEEDIATDSVFHDMDNTLDILQRQLGTIVAACESDDDYDEWKEEYISDEYEKLKDTKFIVCGYLFAGIGKYEMVIPEEALESFKCWIDGNGSAFFTGTHDAEEADVKKFIALHANDK